MHIQAKQATRISTPNFPWIGCVQFVYCIYIPIVHVRTMTRTMVLPTQWSEVGRLQPPLGIYNHHSIHFTISLCIKYYRNMIVLVLYVQINWVFHQGRNVIVSVKDLRSVVSFSTNMLDPFNMTACGQCMAESSKCSL